MSCAANGPGGQFELLAPQVLSMEHLGMFPTAINLIFDAVRGCVTRGSETGQLGRDIKHDWKGFVTCRTPHPSHLCVQARRCCFAHPNSTYTFCFGLLTSAWNFVHTSLMLLIEWSGADHSPGFCFKMFAAFTASALWLFRLGQEPPAIRVSSSQSSCRLGLNYLCHLLGKLHSLSHKSLLL